MTIRINLQFIRQCWRFGSVTFSLSLVTALLCLSHAAVAQTAAQLVVGGRPALFEVSPYVDSNGIVMAPVDFVRLLGAQFAANPDNTVTITSAAGKCLTVPYQHFEDRLMVPVQSTAEKLGASATWSPSNNTLTLRAKLEVARVEGDNVIVATSYPIYYKTQTLDSPPRLVIDLFGADLDSPPAIVPSDDTNVTQIRSGQLDNQTVRLVLDLAHSINYCVASSLQTNVVKLALNTPETDTTPVPVIGSTPEQVPPSQEANAQDSSSQPSAVVPPGLVLLPPLAQAGTTPYSGAPVKIVNVEYRAVNPQVSQVIVTTAGPINVGENSYKAFFLADPNRLEFEVLGSSISVQNALGQEIDSLIPETNPLFQSIAWDIDNAITGGSGRVTLALSSSVVYTITSENLDNNTGVRYIINIQQAAQYPDNGPSNSIVGKVIIVDPGHGGKDSGAPGRGIYEKNFTLAIGKFVRDALVAAGATAIMTRSDDTFIPLDERSQLGIRAHADFFISIHADSSGQQNSHSGDTVYYHGTVSICRDLARSISNRLAQLDIGIKADGVRSDYVRFPGIGFSVLRKSPEPAVLVECGYVNDDNDANSLEDTNTQQELATAIVAGLRDYVANQ